MILLSHVLLPFPKATKYTAYDLQLETILRSILSPHGTASDRTSHPPVEPTKSPSSPTPTLTKILRPIRSRRKLLQFVYDQVVHEPIRLLARKLKNLAVLNILVTVSQRKLDAERKGTRPIMPALSSTHNGALAQFTPDALDDLAHGNGNRRCTEFSWHFAKYALKSKNRAPVYDVIFGCVTERVELAVQRSIHPFD